METCPICNKSVDRLETHTNQFHSEVTEMYANEEYFSGESKWECLDCEKEISETPREHQDLTGHHNISKMKESMEGDFWGDKKNYEVDPDEYIKTGEPVAKQPDDKRAHEAGYPQPWSQSDLNSLGNSAKYFENATWYSHDDLLEYNAICKICGEQVNSPDYIRPARFIDHLKQHNISEYYEGFACETCDYVTDNTQSAIEHEHDMAHYKYTRENANYQGTWALLQTDQKMSALESIGFTQGDAYELSNVDWFDLSNEVRGKLGKIEIEHAKEIIHESQSFLDYDKLIAKEEGSLANSIKHGDKVTIVTSNGQQITGKAVMRSSAGGWVINTGGAHGRPALADDSNVISVESVSNEVSIDDFQRIVRNHQYEKLNFNDGKVLVDGFTASAITQVYDAIKNKPEAVDKFNRMIQTSYGVSKIASIAFGGSESFSTEGFWDDVRNNKCPQCGQQFNDRKALDMHYDDKHVGTCNICGVSIDKHNNPNVPFGGRAPTDHYYSGNDSLYESFEDKKKAKEFSDVTKSAVTDFDKTKGNPYYAFKCKECKKQFFTNYDLLDHWDEAHPDKEFDSILNEAQGWTDPSGYYHTPDEVARGVKDTWNKIDWKSIEDLRFARGQDEDDDSRIERIKSGASPQWMGEDKFKKGFMPWQEGGETMTMTEAIFSDDPNAIPQLEAKLADLEQQKAYWKTIPKTVPRDYSNTPGDARWYMLDNVNANIRTVKKRIEYLKDLQARNVTLQRNDTYKDGKKRFFYTEQPNGESLATENDRELLTKIRNIVKDYGQYSPSLDGVWHQLPDDKLKFVLGGYSLNKLSDEQVLNNLDTLLAEESLSEERDDPALYDKWGFNPDGYDKDGFYSGYPGGFASMGKHKSGTYYDEDAMTRSDRMLQNAEDAVYNYVRQHPNSSERDILFGLGWQNGTSGGNVIRMAIRKGTIKQSGNGYIARESVSNEDFIPEDWGVTTPYFCPTCGMGSNEQEDVEFHMTQANHWL